MLHLVFNDHWKPIKYQKMYVLTNVTTGQFSVTSLNGVNTMAVRDALGSAVQNAEFTFV